MDLNCLPFPDKCPRAIASLDSPVDARAVGFHSRWLADGRHAGMAYMENYADLRTDPRTLLPGARSIICVAFPYYTDRPVSLPISLYARGRDYHEVVRRLLEPLAAALPGQSRICVDTAPLRERYWAMRAGLGFIGRNNQLIIPGAGSYFFLGFVLTTEALPPTAASVEFGCGDCRRCVDACPGGCISADCRAIDARTCLSYLTIEHRGPLPDGLRLPTLYGCDVCQRVCPHNAGVQPTHIADFYPSAELAALTGADVASLTPERFSALFRHSAIKRTKLSGLLRNLSHMSERRSDWSEAQPPATDPC